MKELKHLKTFEQFGTKDFNKIEEGLFDNLVIKDVKTILTKLFAREDIEITDANVKAVFDELTNLKKEGKIKKIGGAGLNRAKRGIKLTTKISDKDDLYYDDTKGSGAGLKG